MNFKVTFAIYDSEPIACEGDDPFTRQGHSKIFSDLENIVDHAHQKAVALSKAFKLHFQVWSIDKA